MKHYPYTTKETDHLSKADPKLAALIAEHGIINRTIRPDLFEALVASIVSQQISTKAVESVFNRLVEAVGELAPPMILAKSDDELRACGLSYRKVGYIKGICEAVRNGDLDLERLREATDAEVIEELVKLKGIGVWSAEMFLIFSLQREDILSFGDLGIRNGLMRLHGLESLSKEEFDVFKARYSPYGTVASFYLWALANG